MKKLFGTDGIRGVANIYPMTSEIAMQIGRAIAFIVKNQVRGNTIVIGKDTRLSGYMLENALAAGICSMGVNVQLVGPLPTPGIAFITTSMRADAGVVISASHNPFQDNGIKIFSADGFKLPDEQEADIEDLIFSQKMAALRPVADEVGKASRIEGRDTPNSSANCRSGGNFDLAVYTPRTMRSSNTNAICSNNFWVFITLPPRFYIAHRKSIVY